MIRTLLFVLAILMNGCGSKTDADSNSYSVVDLFEENNCKIYVMEFRTQQDVLFRFATSGKCNELTSEEYTLTYKKYLEEPHRKTMSIVKQKIRLDYPSTFAFDRMEIMAITKKTFNCEVSIAQTWDDGIELVLFRK
jgi:hypothetical protein